jgi:hypothetical protein
VLGEILQRVGLHGLDRKVIAIRAQEAEKEEELLEQGKDVDEKELIREMENTHIESKELKDI